jgi:hypothetical protein
MIAGVYYLVKGRKMYAGPVVLVDRSEKAGSTDETCMAKREENN